MIHYLSKAGKEVLRGTALLRLDFNAQDEWRMKAALPTVHFLVKHLDKIIILSHRGRPTFTKVSAGKPPGFDPKLSLKKDAANLARLLGRKVSFVQDLDVSKIKKAVNNSQKGSIFVLENLRFFKGEAENDRNFAQKLASLGDFYVNDAFAVSHRRNASISAITEFLPSFAGLELEKEIKFLSKTMIRPKKPLIIIIGGAKAHDKLGVMKYFKNKADCFLVAGASANTLLSICGVDVKDSMVSKDKNDREDLCKAVDYKNLILPVDFKFGGKMILDIGKKTEALFAKKIKTAQTIIWSGPIGAFEQKKFASGTLAVAKAIARNKKAFSVVGGGETVSFLKDRGLSKNFSFISTGGGAMLEFLAGNKLPGIAVLEKGEPRQRREALEQRKS